MSPARRRVHAYNSPYAYYGGIAAALGLVAYFALYRATDWNPYGAWVAAWSGVTLLFYGYDKWQAVSGGRRVPKLVLHALALAGGFLGGWAGMLVFRHKVRQGEFWLALILATLLHAALVYVRFVG